MTELTKEQLIEEAKLKIAIAKCHTNSGMARVEGELFKIALASLEAQPIAWECGENIILFNPDIVEAYAKRAEISPKQLFSAPPALVVPDEMDLLTCHLDGVTETYADGRNACRAAMLQSQGEGNPHVTPARLPGGFTIEDAKELHEDLVRSHISQALSGEKMKKKDRDADLRWIHGVIVQAAWFVKASLEQNALSGNSPVTPDGWISCSDAVPAEYCDVILLDDLGNVFPGSWDKVFCPTRGGNKMAFVDKDGVEVESSTHWMPLPEPPQEVNQ